jgi:hypothetical protein
MAHLNTVYAKVKRLGATVDSRVEGRGRSINLDAPQGKVWGATFTHTLAYSSPSWFPASDLIPEIEGDIAYGLTDCTTPDCDVCGEEG